MTKKYEVTYLSLDEQALDAVAVAEFLGEINANIIEVSPWGGRRTLAYPIKHENQAFYTTVVFEAEPSKISILTKELNTHPDQILRSIILEHQDQPVRTAKPKAETEDVKAVELKPEVKAEIEKIEEQPVKTESTSVETAESKVAEPEKVAEPVKKEVKKRAAKKPTEPNPDLDAKLEEILNEDITS